MKCGDICLVQYPFTDGSAAKLRPVLIVSDDRFHGGEDIVVVPISSTPLKHERWCVLLDLSSPHFVGTGLKYPSAIKCTKPLTIARRLFQRKLGRLPPSVMEEVRIILAELFSIKASST